MLTSMPSFTFFKAVQWVRLESLPGRVWPPGLIFDMYDLDNIKAGWGARGARAEDGEIIVGLIRMDRIRYKYIRDKIRESSAFE